MKLHTEACTDLDDTMCQDKERQVLPSCFLSYMPLQCVVGHLGHFVALSC